MPKIISISVALYRRLLALYPADYRREFGDAMTQLFRDQCRDAWAARRSCGLAALWVRALADLARSVTSEHLRAPLRLRLVFLRIFAIVFALVFSFGILGAFFTQPYYESTATIEPRPASRLDATAPYFLITQSQIIRSDAVLTNALASLQLPDIYRAFGGDNPLLPAMLARKDNLRPGDQMCPYLYRHVSVNRRPYTQLLEITVRLHNPILAANIANAVAQSYADERFRMDHTLVPFPVRDPARPARKPSLPDTADLIIPALSATLLALTTALLALALHSLKKILPGKGLNSPT